MNTNMWLIYDALKAYVAAKLHGPTENGWNIRNLNQGSDNYGPNLHENKKNTAAGNVYGDIYGIVHAGQGIVQHSR